MHGGAVVVRRQAPGAGRRDDWRAGLFGLGDQSLCKAAAGQGSHGGGRILGLGLLIVRAPLPCTSSAVSARRMMMPPRSRRPRPVRPAHASDAHA